jgi:O-antigen/teichoic acid export membrane protein
VSRTARASIAAAFAYVQVGANMITGLWLVPFTLRHVGPRLYGLWLASGELLAYAALAELGVLVTLPWLIAEADGRRDRARMRHLVSTGAAAATLTAVLYGLLAVALWIFFPRLLRMNAVDHRMIRGPLLLIAIAGCLAQPLRAFGCVLAGLQDVRFNGVLSFANWLMGFVLCVWLLAHGWGLYGLAVAAAFPSLVTGVWSLLRVRIIAPDLLHAWPRPRWVDIHRLFVEGIGTWIGGWGWRLIAASDNLVVGLVGRPTQIAALACTNKLAQALVQLSWIPCDSGLIGLAQLAGEKQVARLRDAIVVMIRVYLSLAGAVACLVLAVNPAFVRAWVGPDLYAGGVANALIAALAIVMTLAHAIAVVPSVLGQRLQIGVATLAAGVLHVAIAVALGTYYGIAGVLLAGIVSHGFVFCALAWKAFAHATGTTEIALLGDVVWPWARRVVPMLALAALIQRVAGMPPLYLTILGGAAVAGVVMLVMRPLYIEFGPVRFLYDRVMRWSPRRPVDAETL